MKKLFLILALCACSFHPMYMDGQQFDVYVAPISGTNGIDLRNALNAKFGDVQDTTAKYSLVVDLKTPITQYKALDTTGSASWQEITVNASYVLKKDGKEIASGSDSSSESYTFARYLVAANASYNNAVSNSIQILSDKIGMRVMAEIRKNERLSQE